MKKFEIITPEKRVACLKGYENFDTESISKRKSRFFKVKSITELKMERDRRLRILIWKPQ